jgi:hypothetical protein
MGQVGLKPLNRMPVSLPLEQEEKGLERWGRCGGLASLGDGVWQCGKNAVYIIYLFYENVLYFDLTHRILRVGSGW